MLNFSAAESGFNPEIEPPVPVVSSGTAAESNTSDDGCPKRTRSRTGNGGDWTKDPRKLMRDLVNGHRSLHERKLQAGYLDWMESRDYILYKNTETGDMHSALSCKRGNIVYAARKSAMRKEVADALERNEFDYPVPHSRMQRFTRILFVTFSFDRVRFTAEQAWAALRSTPIDDSDGGFGYVNRLTANLRKVFGPFGKLIAKEAQLSGYPAPHMILILDNPVKVEKFSGRKGTSWRLCDPHILRRIGKDPLLRRLSFNDHRRAMMMNPIWKHGFIDFEGVVKGDGFKGRKNVANYPFKYITKCLVDNESDAIAGFDDIDSVSDSKMRIALNTHYANKCFCTRDITYGKGFKDRLGLLPHIRSSAPSPWIMLGMIPGYVHDLAVRSVKNHLAEDATIPD